MKSSHHSIVISILIFLFFILSFEPSRAADCPAGKYGSDCSSTCPSECDACLNASVCTSEFKYPGYLMYIGKDSGLGDVSTTPMSTSNFSAIVLRCTGSRDCLGFNEGGYLKQTIRPQNEWTGGTTSRLYVKNGSHLELERYTFYQGKDSSSNELTSFYTSTKNLTAMKIFCDGHPQCFGLSTEGYVKQLIKAQGNWDTISGAPQDFGLYVKSSTPPSLDGYTFFQGKDYVGVNITFVDDKNLTTMKAACDSNPECVGLSSLGWLKKTLGSPYAWTTTASSAADYGLFAKNIDPQNLAGYTFYHGKDSAGANLTQVSDRNYTAMKIMCDGNPDCFGFNSLGWLKKALGAQASWPSLDDSPTDYGLYVKSSTSPSLAGYTFFQGKDDVGVNITFVDNKDLTTMRTMCESNSECVGISSLGWLKKTLGSPYGWTTIANSAPDYGLFAKNIDPQNLAGYTFYHGKDSAGDNLTQVADRNLTAMRIMCSGNPDCFGFNSLGWLKQPLGIQANWPSLDNSPTDYGLYTKNDGHTDLVNYTFYQGMDSINGVNITIIDDKNLTEMKRICDSDNTCFGFNSMGYIKAAVGAQSDWTSIPGSAQDYGLYVKFYTCPNTKYWIWDSGCTGNCTVGCKTCSNTTTCEVCTDQTNLYTDGYCKCNAEGYYFDKTQQACTGACPNYCSYCRDGTSCQECKGRMIWQDSKCQCASPKIFVNGTCQCPSGTTENSQTSFCDSVLFLDIIYQSKVSPYTNLLVQAKMAPEEEANFTAVFKWKFESATANATILSSLKNYLASQTTKNLLVLPTYLEPNTVYTVTANYTNAEGTPVFKSVSIQTTGLELQASIKGGPAQTLDYTVINTIAAEVFSATGSTVSSSLIDVIWSQTGGDTLNLATLTSSITPFLLKIPKCTLVTGKTYNFTVAVKEKGTSNTPSTAKLDILSPPLKLNVTIPNRGSTQKAGVSLLLQPALSLKDDCHLLDINSVLDMTTRQDTWECYLIDSQGVSVECNDTNHVLYPPQGTTSLSVPPSYFSDYVGKELFMKLKVNVLKKSSTEILSASTEASFTIAALDSSTEVSLDQILAGVPSMFEVLLASSAAHTYSYQWQFTPNISFAFFPPKLKVYTDLSTLASLASGRRRLAESDASSTYVSARLTATDELGAVNFLYYRLPINTPPRSGTIAVSPMSGKSLDTNFFMSTSGWIDEDIPLTYQFFYSVNETNEYTPVGSAQLSSYTYSQLVSTPSHTTMYVKVSATDSLGDSNYDTTQVTVEPNTDVSQITSQILDFISRKDDMSPTELNNLLNLAAQGLSVLESVTSTTSTCPSCSGHGTCGNTTQCVCDAGYTLADCSMTQVQVDSITNTKLSVINAMKEVSSSIKEDPTLSAAMSNTLQALSADPRFNTDATFSGIMDTLESVLNLNNPSTILTTAQSSSVANILSNALSYADTTDSSMEGSFTSTLEDKLNSYTSVIYNSLLTNMIPGEDPAIIQTDNFALYATKMPVCNLSTIDVGPDYPVVELEIANVTNCSKSIDVKYIAIKGDLLGGGSSGQSIVGLDVSDSETGKSIPGLTAKVYPPGNQQCPVNCDKIDGGACYCADIFDMKAQFAKIFKKSNIGKLGNISAFVNFKFWESLAAWSAIAFTTWFLISLYVVKFRKPKYNIVDKLKRSKRQVQIKEKSAFRKRLEQSRVLLLITHPILGIYFYNDEQMSKVTKLILYYQQIIFNLTYTAIFPTAGQESVILAKVILIIIKSITVTPLTIIITLLIKDLDPNDKTPLTWFRRNKRKIGIVLSTLCSAGCLYIIFIISAQTDFEAQKEWTVNFLIVLIQGILVSPPAVLAVHIMLIIYGAKFAAKVPILKTVVPKVISKDIQELYTKVVIEPNRPSATDTPTSPDAEEKAALSKQQLDTDPANISLQEVPLEFLSPNDSPAVLNKAQRQKTMLSQKMTPASGTRSSRSSLLLNQLGQEIKLNFNKGIDSPFSHGGTEENLLFNQSPSAKRNEKKRNTISSQDAKSDQILKHC